MPMQKKQTQVQLVGLSLCYCFNEVCSSAQCWKCVFQNTQIMKTLYLLSRMLWWLVCYCIILPFFLLPKQPWPVEEWITLDPWRGIWHQDVSSRSVKALWNGLCLIGLGNVQAKWKTSVIMVLYWLFLEHFLLCGWRCYSEKGDHNH